MSLASSSLASGSNPNLRVPAFGIDFPPLVPNAMDDEFDDDSFDTSKWTWLDQGSTTVSESNGHLLLTLPSDSNRIRGVYQSAPTAPWVFRAKVVFPIGRPGTVFSGLFAAASTSGEVRGVGIWGATGARAMTWASPSSTAAAWDINLANRMWMPRHAWVQLAYDGTNITAGYSADGQGFYRGGSVALSATIVGLCIGNAQTPTVTFPFEWFRRVV
jgi:hypothetical protein